MYDGDIWRYMEIYGDIWRYMEIYGDIYIYVGICILMALATHPVLSYSAFP
jgi:hypothetical protein